jgi:hypothetical protein
MVRERARGRRHWVTGSGSAEMAQTIKRMYQRGRIGPLWDRRGWLACRRGGSLFLVSTLALAAMAVVLVETSDARGALDWVDLCWAATLH